MGNLLSGMRKDYTRHTLTEENAALDPLDQFSSWFDMARKEYEGEANAMILSTSGKSHFPSSRVVLLKDFSKKGFVFFTNYLSRKGQEITFNPQVSLLFFWHGLERQVRIEGMAEKISQEESDIYFASRPEESRIGASISPQSQAISGRKFLEDQYKEVKKKNPDSIPRPEHWGGYNVNPIYFEFWQGRKGRLHDRIAYTLEDNTWKKQRLAP